MADLSHDDILAIGLLVTGFVPGFIFGAYVGSRAAYRNALRLLQAARGVTLPAAPARVVPPPVTFAPRIVPPPAIVPARRNVQRAARTDSIDQAARTVPHLNEFGEVVNAQAIHGSTT